MRPPDASPQDPTRLTSAILGGLSSPDPGSGVPLTGSHQGAFNTLFWERNPCRKRVLWRACAALGPCRAYRYEPGRICRIDALLPSNRQFTPRLLDTIVLSSFKP
jgi:hypothetical protein